MKRPLPLLFAALSVIMFSCDSDEASVPVLTTSDVSSITYTTASGGGTVSGDGGSPITQRGICWSTSSEPTLNDNSTTDSGTTGSFTGEMTGLSPNTTYFVRAYASNGVGTGYGEAKSFTTVALALPTLTTSAVTNIKFNSALSGGDVTSANGSPITARGVVWNTQPEPTVSNNKTTQDPATGTFQSELTNLATGTTYYVRAYATNAVGTAYGNQLTFNTPPGEAPVVSGVTASEKNRTSIKVAASVTSDGGLPILERGVCWIKPADGDVTTLPTIASEKVVATAGSGEFTVQIVGLEQLTTYRVRAYARNSAGITYGLVANIKTRGPFEGVYEIIEGSITRNTSAGPDPILGGTYTVGQEMRLTSRSAYSVFIEPTYRDGSVIGGTSFTYLHVDESVDLAGGAHPVTIRSESNPVLENTAGTESKFVRGVPDFTSPTTPQEFVLNFSWGFGDNTRVITNLRLRYKKPLE
jgi:hypothetical protein